jgi:hypothetical protein
MFRDGVKPRLATKSVALFVIYIEVHPIISLPLQELLQEQATAVFKTRLVRGIFSECFVGV